MIDSPNIVTDPGSVLLFPFLTSSQRPIRALISGSIFIYKIFFFFALREFYRTRGSCMMRWTPDRVLNMLVPLTYNGTPTDMNFAKPSRKVVHQ